MKFQDIIIGGGASGTAAAIMLARKGRKVAVLEAQDRILRKVLASGNGRCNLSNARVCPQRYNAPDFVAPALEVFSSKAKSFFNSLGLELTEEDGRIYPYSLSANNVVNALRRAAEYAGVKFFCGCKAEKIEKGKKFEVFSEEGVFESENLIFATGSNATSGSDSLSLLKKYGHNSTRKTASICYIPSQSVKGASGVRAHARLRLYCGKEELFDKEGELLFKDNALSGILAFEASSYYARALRRGLKCYGMIDFVPDREESEIAEFLKRAGGDCRNALCAYLHSALAVAVAKKAGAEGDVEENAQSLAKAVKNYRVDFDGECDIKNAQVICGGLELEGFDRTTLQSAKVRGLYATGEALDVDGDCGGFNLHWAWASAYVVAEAIEGGNND